MNYSYENSEENPWGSLGGKVVTTNYKDNTYDHFWPRSGCPEGRIALPKQDIYLVYPPTWTLGGGVRAQTLRNLHYLAIQGTNYEKNDNFWSAPYVRIATPLIKLLWFWHFRWILVCTSCCPYIGCKPKKSLLYVIYTPNGHAKQGS